ncbi:hypothetical protein KP509_08G061600 [Ceratopteris richardii]|uniref:Uncharacterized protein n=1 Tax=Ceratopteris richardii TaxID=49495 RepID=A0A8T2U646_CERRI|nr:hypothetical protein KP509_08G061600 [Ceratopteris richardii]
MLLGSTGPQSKYFFCRYLSILTTCKKSSSTEHTSLFTLYLHHPTRNARILLICTINRMINQILTKYLSQILLIFVKHPIEELRVDYSLPLVRGSHKSSRSALLKVLDEEKSTSNLYCRQYLDSK